MPAIREVDRQVTPTSYLCRVLMVRDCVPSLWKVWTFQPETFITSLRTRTVVACWFITSPAKQKTGTLGTYAVDALVLFVISLFMLLIEEDTLGFDWGKGPKSYPEKCPVCCRFSTDFCRFSTDTLAEWPEAAGCRNRHLLDFHQSPFSRVAALIPPGASWIR